MLGKGSSYMWPRKQPMSKHWTFTRGTVSDVSDLIQCFMFIPIYFTMYFKFSGKTDKKKTLLLGKDSKERKNRFMNTQYLG